MDFELMLDQAPPSANARLIPLIIKGRARLVKSKDDRVFQRAVAAAFAAKYAGRDPFMGPVLLEIEVTLRMVTADVSNRIKTVEDALTGLAYVDDCQVAALKTFKRLGPVEHFKVRVSEIPHDEADAELVARLASTKKLREARTVVSEVDEYNPVF